MSRNQNIALIVVPDRDDPECADVFVDGLIVGRPFRFILDTGAGRTHVLANQVTAPFVVLKVDSAAGVFLSTSEEVIRIPEIMVGPMMRSEVEAIRFGSRHPAPRNLLGMDVIGAYRCHFRFGENVLSVGEPPTGASLAELEMDGAGHPCVDVMLGGSAVCAVWDSGAGITVVDEEFVARHPQHFDESVPSRGMDATGAVVETSTFVMSGASVGGRRFAPHRVAAVDLSAASGDPENPLSMILGYTTLCQADWYFDFPGKSWAITRVHSPDLPVETGGHPE